MTDATGPGRCLNCSAPLHGPFCAACGQRAVPPNPTARELAGDAWHELSGYDGRIMATIRGLMRPGFLTREYLAGRRAHYLPPLRVYLIVSVVYFLVAASGPESMAPGGVRIELDQAGGGAALSAEDRAALEATIKDAPWYVQPMLHSIADDQAAFRGRIFTIMPRVFFALLPVFAGIVALFYRGRTFPAALVFATHLHAFAFVVSTMSELSKFTGSRAFAASVGVAAAVLFIVYALRSFRAVFPGGWVVTFVKAAGIAVVYLTASVPAYLVMLAWASWT